MVLPTRTYLINLDRSKDRLKEFWRYNERLKIDVERFPGVDGSKLSIADLQANGQIDAVIAKTYTPGAIGATLSHAALWDKAIAADEAITIIEDDAIFNFDFEAASRDFFGRLHDDWDFVLWGWNFDAPLLFELMPNVSPCLDNFNQAQMLTAVEQFQKLSLAPLGFRLLRCFGVPCYSVSPRGARALKAGCVPIRAMTVFFPGLNQNIANVGIDCMMNAVFPNIKAYLSFPPLVITKNELGKSLSQRKPK
jgi:glycosyl transferase family 25